MHASAQPAHARHQEARAIETAVPEAVATQFRAEESAGSAQSTPRGPGGTASAAAPAPASASPSTAPPTARGAGEEWQGWQGWWRGQ
eukprot:3048950-Lingulodinium_polyedra.AAC.1